MADSLWKSRPEFIPSIIVYSIAFVVSLDIFIVKNQTTNLTSASYTCHCTIYIVNREQKHSTTSQNTFDKFLGAQHLKLCCEAHYSEIFIRSFNLYFWHSIAVGITDINRQTSPWDPFSIHILNTECIRIPWVSTAPEKNSFWKFSGTERPPKNALFGQFPCPSKTIICRACVPPILMLIWTVLLQT